MRRLLPLLLLAAPAPPGRSRKATSSRCRPCRRRRRAWKPSTKTSSRRSPSSSPETETREEFRIKGKLYMVKVTPAVGKPYYLVDRQGDGIMVDVGLDQRPTKPPMWVIHSW